MHSGLQVLYTHQLIVVFLLHKGLIESLGVQSWDLLVKGNIIINNKFT